MRRLIIVTIAVLAVVAIVAAIVWNRNSSTPVASFDANGPGAAGKAVPAAAASPADDGNWTMPGKDYASTRFSGLNEINPANVGQLKVATTFSTGTTEGFEAPPLVVGDTMYIVAPWPNNVFAIDLTQPGGATKWVYEPKPSAAAKGVACCGPVNRGAVYADGRLYMNLLDGNTVAIDAASGKEVWRTKVADIQKGETLTMAPLVADGKVLVGNSGGEMGVRGWLTALDAANGSLTWRAYTTGPDKDVLIGPNYRAPYPSDSGKDLGVTSWPAGYWKIGGGTVWGWLSYDPELHLVYYGTSNPGPWNASQRPGDNKFTAGVFARDISTGQARWFYQSTPHDLFDHDDINEILLVDWPAPNDSRIPALIRPSRNGYFYVQDRRTGKVLSADPYSYINAYRGVDLRSGRLIPVKEKEPLVTDPESRIMFRDGAFLQAYNGHLAVDEANQIIVAAALSNQCPDAEYFQPMLKRVVVNCGRVPERATADSGFFSAANMHYAEHLGVEPFIAVNRNKRDGMPGDEIKQLASYDTPERRDMRALLETERGRAAYSRRKATVEPVFGQIKSARGFRQISFRGLVKARLEWLLVAATHNLRKLWRLSPAAQPA